MICHVDIDPTVGISSFVGRAVYCGSPVSEVTLFLQSYKAAGLRGLHQ